MTDKTREVYKDTNNPIPTLNPFVDMPRMRVDAINRLNELIKRNEARPMIARFIKELNKTKYYCPVCEAYIVDAENYKFCPKCGQRLDTDNIEL